MEITKEQWQLYLKATETEKISSWATYAISQKTGLSYEEVKFIGSNYNLLEQKYGNK